MPFVINRHISIYLKHKQGSKDNKYYIVCLQKHIQKYNRHQISLLAILEEKKFCWLYHTDGKFPKESEEVFKLLNESKDQ